MDSSKKQDIVGLCFIVRTTADDGRGSCVLPLFNITQRRLTETLRTSLRATDPEQLMTTSNEPVSSFRPPLDMVVAISILPQELCMFMFSDTVGLGERNLKGRTVRHAVVGTFPSSTSASHTAKVCPMR